MRPLWLVAPFALLAPACLLDVEGPPAQGETTTSSSAESSAEATSTVSSSSSSASGGGEGGAGGSVASGGGQGGAGGQGGSCEVLSARFDGVDDVITVAVPNGRMEKKSDFGFQAWVTPDVAAVPTGWIGPIVVLGDFGTEKGAGLALVEQAGQVRARFTVFTENAAAKQCTILSGALTDGARVHLAGTYKKPTLRLYVDGVPVTADCGNFDADLLVGEKVMGIGRSSSNTGAFFQGLLDDVAYRDNAFDTATITPPAPFTDCPANGKAAYSFDGVTLVPDPASGVQDLCGDDLDAVVGGATGADAADPTFECTD